MVIYSLRLPDRTKTPDTPDGKSRTGLPPKLALAELEPPAGAGLAVFLPFNHAGIPRKIAVASEAGIICMINLTEGSGKTVAARAGLTVNSAAKNVDQHVKFILVGGYHEGLTHHKDMFTLGKINGQFLAVDYYFAGSVPQIHPGDGSLSSSGSDAKILNHTIPLIN
jgi:hypothetical protein